MQRVWLILGAMILGSTITACGDGDADTRVTGSVPSSISVPSSVSDVSVADAVDARELLYISDSSGWKVGEAYARHAEEALGVPVRLVSWRVPSMGLVQARQMIADSPGTVAAADIVVLWGHMLDTGAREDGLFACATGDPDVQFEPYTPEDWAPYVDLLVQTFDEIRTLRDGEPTVLRAVDLYVPVLAKWRASGVDDRCIAFMESQTAAIRTAAEAAGVTMVSVFDALNGPAHDQDPVTAGYILSDGEHLTDAGGEVAAAALAAAGFEPDPAP